MTLSPVRILVVDDHAPTLNQWKLSLENKQFDVLTAHQGQIAYELACEHQPDIILSDIDMPEVDGFQLLTLLKKTPTTAEIPVVVCSGTTDQTSKFLALTLGAAEYFTKPLDISAFIHVVDEHCCTRSISA